jgi:S-adenosylmethionine hydrolase
VVQLHRPAGISATFEGRNVFAPTAAALALGRALSDVGEPAAAPLIELPERGASVVWDDRLGILTTI